MFKKASLKIMPHSSAAASNTNQDVRPIQNLLSAEKAVLLSRVLLELAHFDLHFWLRNRLQKLSVDYAKSAEALRTWGLSEDNDLGVSPLHILLDELLFTVFLAIGHSYCFNIPSKPFFFGSVAMCNTWPNHATPTRGHGKERRISR